MKKVFALLVLLVVVSFAFAQTEVRWYVGLGSGTDASMIDPQNEFVAAFNASQDEIELVLEIVDNDSAYDVLATQIAAGNPPDIVGPMGIRGRDAFPGAWLDIGPLMEAVDYDVSDFDPALIDFYATDSGEQLGIPFAVFPSFIGYNRDLFDEAGLAYPPTEYGVPYVDADGNEHPWNYDTLRELAIELTVDSNGNTPNDAGFDSNDVVQWGYGVQWSDLRGHLSLFGADTMVDENGQAYISDAWRDAIQWYHDAMWKDFFIPNGPYGGSDLLGGGNWLNSGNMAMSHNHLWYQNCCLSDQDNWDLAPMVANADGVITAKLHGDTFGIMKGTKNPEAAFTVLSHMLGDASEELAALYGGFPARTSLQDSFFAGWQEEKFAGQTLNWDIAVASLNYPDSPNHEAGLPGGTEANDTINQFQTLLNNDADLDIDAELATMLAELQLVVDASR